MSSRDGAVSQAEMNVLDARERLLSMADALIVSLQQNEWPLGADRRPLTDLGQGPWTELTPAEKEADPERAERIERAKVGEKDCQQWRGRLRLFIEDCQRYLNDYGDSDHMRRFTNNKLVVISDCWDQLSREFYRTSECLEDLNSLKSLVTRVQITDGSGVPNASTAAPTTVRPECGPRSMFAPQAAGRLKKYLADHGLNPSSFARAHRGKFSDRAVRKLLNSSITTHSVLDGIADALKTSKEDLLRHE